MEKLYIVYHVYDVDGGFGDAVSRDVPVFVAPASIAKAYCEKWDNEHPYEKPYDFLECGYLFCKELPDLITEDDLDKPPHEINPRLSWAFDKSYEGYRDARSECNGCAYYVACGSQDRFEPCSGRKDFLDRECEDCTKNDICGGTCENIRCYEYEFNGKSHREVTA